MINKISFFDNSCSKQVYGMNWSVKEMVTNKDKLFGQAEKPRSLFGGFPRSGDKKFKPIQWDKKLSTNDKLFESEKSQKFASECEEMRVSCKNAPFESEKSQRCLKLNKAVDAKILNANGVVEYSQKVVDDMSDLFGRDMTDSGDLATLEEYLSSMSELEVKSGKN